MRALWFHAVAGLILVAATVNQLAGPLSRPVAYEIPRDRLVAAMAQQGLVAVSRVSFLGDDRISFSDRSCAAPIDVLMLPNSYPEATATRRYLAMASGRHFIIHDGELVPGAVPSVLMPRLVWRKLLIGLNIRPPQPWSAMVLVVIVPEDCAPPAIDWWTLARAA